ncbi:MAG: acyl carrier protein [Segetibacter sp.]
MEQQKIKQKIFNTMSLVFEVPETEINEESSTDTIENWDSLRHLNLILALEEEFDISIPDEEVGNMVNYKIIDHVINETLNNG